MLLVLLISSLTFSYTTTASSSTVQRLPNIVIIFADDLGYADLGSYGATAYKTPNLDRMAKEGTRFTNFYVPQAVCSASRAALLTGNYPNRIGINGALDHTSRNGLSDSETTIAELVKTKGYSTAMFGKWHLGHHTQFLPTRHGFDEYLGLPYSNDMWPDNAFRRNYYPPLPLIEGDKVVENNPDQSQLTRRYTERAVAYIEKNKNNPFFLYLAHSMPHVPIYASEKFKGKTGSVYGDVITEIDWSVGQVLDTLKRSNIDKNTLVIFTSDNGPWLIFGNHGGSAGPLREGKGTEWDGGVREPFIARWPGHIPAGRVSHVPAMTIDLLPTIAKITHATLSDDKTIDGKDISPLLFGKRKAKSPHDAYYFYWLRELHAVRSGKWKLHVPHPYFVIKEPGKDGVRGKAEDRKTTFELYDLENDIGEKNNVADKNPDVVKQMMIYVEQAREDLGDSLTKREGKNVRKPGVIQGN